MTEAIINNIIQRSNNDFSPAKREKAPQNNDKSFSETMQEINQQNKRAKKAAVKNNDAVKEKSSSPSNQEFLAKLKEILSKNKKDVPSELLSLLQGGNLNKQQEAMLESLMLNLKNSDLDISDLKSLLDKNNEQLNTENNKELQFFNEAENSKEIDFKSLNADDLEKIVALLAKDGEKTLENLESSDILNDPELLKELDQLSEKVFEFNSNNESEADLAQNLEQILSSENLENKLGELAKLLEDVDFSSEDLAELTEQKDLEMPILKELFSSENLELDTLSDNLNSKTNSSLFEELAAQIKEMLNDENNKVQKQNSEVKISNSELFSTDKNSTLDFLFKGGELEAKNQNNSFDLDNSGLLFNFDLENQDTANNLNTENFSLDNNVNLAENTDLRAQVVEQFRGEYSPETKEMQIQLKPESLGKIDISLSYDNEQLTGKMLVESEVVRAQLENSLKGLKSDLLKQGINIEQFKIETAKNAPQQVEKQNDFAFNDQNAAFSDGETGQNQEYEQRQFFQGQYYVQRNNGSSGLDNENIIMRQQEMINRAAFSNEKLNLLA